MSKNPYRCKCLRCEYEWIKRSDATPKQCPNCKNPKWNKPRGVPKRVPKGK